MASGNHFLFDWQTRQSCILHCFLIFLAVLHCFRSSRAVLHVSVRQHTGDTPVPTSIQRDHLGRDAAICHLTLGENQGLTADLQPL